MTANQIAYWNLQEQTRHNRRTELEAERHQRADEDERRRSNLVREKVSIADLNMRRDQHELNMFEQGFRLPFKALGDVTTAVHLLGGLV